MSALKQVGKAPADGKYPNAARWYRHLSSFAEKERSAFGAGSGAAGDAPAKAAAAAPADDDDDDVDLFGSDDEEVGMGYFC